MAKQFRTCIFCGKARPQQGTSLAAVATSLPSGSGPRDRPSHDSLSPRGRRRASGEAGDEEPVVAWRSVRHAVSHVCKECNNEWISGLQVRARPALEALLKGERMELMSRHQHALSSWATMFTIVAELADPQTLAVAQSDRGRSGGSW